VIAPPPKEMAEEELGPDPVQEMANKLGVRIPHQIATEREQRARQLHRTETERVQRGAVDPRKMSPLKSGGGGGGGGGGGNQTVVALGHPDLPDLVGEVAYESKESRMVSRLQFRDKGRRVRPASGYVHKVPTLMYACRILGIVLHQNAIRSVVGGNLGAWRLCRALVSAVGYVPEGVKVKGKGKKGGITLLAEGEELADEVLGCLRLLTMIDVEKARVLRTEAIGPIVELVGYINKARIRWNSRAVLGNLSVLFENAELMAGRVPEEFRGVKYMWLSPEHKKDFKVRFW